jgi:hypothetical protein
MTPAMVPVEDSCRVEQVICALPEEYAEEVWHETVRILKCSSRKWHRKISPLNPKS